MKVGTAADEVLAATAATDVILGVADESADATAGNPVGVILDGVVKLCIASASTKGGFITATTGGKGILTTTDTNKYVGVLLETTTVSDQIAQVRLAPGTLSA